MPLGRAQPANKQVIGSGTALGPKGEGGPPLVRLPCWTNPPRRCLSPSRSPGWSMTRQVRRSIFLTDTGATYSVLISHAGPLSSESCTVTGVQGKPHPHYFTGPLTCQFEQRLISHTLLVVPECLTPLLARDLLGSLGATLQLGGKQPLILTLTKVDQGPVPSRILQPVNPAVWDKGVPRRAINAQPVKSALSQKLPTLTRDNTP